METSTTTSSHYAGMSLQDIFAELASRFIVNLPAEELESIERICFQVEQSHWFYEDFIRPIRLDLPAYNLRRFSEHFLAACSTHLSAFSFDPATAYDAFLQYKASVPVRGAILLNPTWDKAILVKGWKSNAAWGFPKGKINQNETDRDCAIREVWEETGYDMSPHYDPNRKPHSQDSHSNPPSLAKGLDLSENDWIDVNIHSQTVRFYIVPGVREDTVFETRTRKEISQISWHALKDLPGWNKKDAGSKRFYMVFPVIRALKAWMSAHKPRKRTSRSGTERQPDIAPPPESIPSPPAKPVFADVEEGNRALHALFFGSNDLPPPQPVPSALPSLLDESSAEEETRHDQLLRLLTTDNVNRQPQPVPFSSHFDSLEDQSSGSPVSARANDATPILNDSDRDRKRNDLMRNLAMITGLAPQEPPAKRDVLQTLFSSVPQRTQSPPRQYPQQDTPRQYASQQDSPRTKGEKANRLLDILTTKESKPQQHQQQWPFSMQQEQGQPLPASLQTNAGPTNTFAHAHHFGPFPPQHQHSHINPNYMQQPFYQTQPFHPPEMHHYSHPQHFAPLQVSQPMPIRPIPLLAQFTSPEPQASPPKQAQRANLLSLFNAPAPNQMPLVSPHPNYPSGSPGRG